MLSPDLQSFERTYKTAYSHGLEEIYALETVDLKSVRRLSDGVVQIAPPSQPPIKQSFEFHEEQQLECDFGDLYRGWIKPFITEEPIQVLGLSGHAEKCLLEHGKALLKDLSGTNLRDLVYFKGMGQGHIDEIQQRLQRYLSGHSLERTRAIAWDSWIRSLVGSFDRKKSFVLLESYGLSELVSLSPAESVEVRRLTLEKRSEWVEEILQQLRVSQSCLNVLENMRKIVEVFIKPWMRQRQGLATPDQLMERLERVSERVDYASKAIKFFSDVYFNGIFPPLRWLYKGEEDLQCVDEMTLERYREVNATALSYFYKPQVMYPFLDLIGRLEREFAKSWITFPEGFVTRALRLSPCFRVRKGGCDLLMIKLV